MLSLTRKQPSRLFKRGISAKPDSGAPIRIIIPRSTASFKLIVGIEVDPSRAAVNYNLPVVPYKSPADSGVQSSEDQGYRVKSKRPLYGWRPVIPAFWEKANRSCAQNLFGYYISVNQALYLEWQCAVLLGYSQSPVQCL